MRKTKKKSKKKADYSASFFDRTQKVFSQAQKVAIPPEKLTVSQWADKYRRLSPENSAEAGKWRTSRTPYLKEIMDSFTDSRVHDIVVVASSQVGKSEMINNMIGYLIDNDPGPAMFCMPTQDDAKDYSKRRLAPMFRDTAHLKRKVAAAKGRDGNNTVTKKKYPGGMLTLVGSNAPRELASVPARYVFGDERDRWAKDAGGEGDPWNLLTARTITFYNAKRVQASTPTIKGHSPIAAEFTKGTQEYWCVKCPHCGEYHFIDFDDIHFKYTCEVIGGRKQYTVTDIEYCCPECGCMSTEDDIRRTEKKWIAKNPDAINHGYRSFWLNGFCSPWLSWETIIRKFLEAKDDPVQLKTVFNTILGRLWEERNDAADEGELMARREHYDAELPDGVLCLTCGVDTQDNRLEYEVVGWGRYGESWGIRKGFIMGRPEENGDVWESLDGVLDHVYKFKNGKGLKISLTFIDSGGHFTQEVYEECRKRIGKRVFAIKGRGGEGVPYTAIPKKQDCVLPNHRPTKVWLYTLGVDSGKERIMSNVTVQEPGANFMHFPDNEDAGYDENFFSGLLSEVMVPSTSHSSQRWTWKKLPGHNRNEALDCRNYAMAAKMVLNPNFDAIDRRLKGLDEEDIQEEQQAKQEARERRRMARRRRRQREEDDW